MNTPSQHASSTGLGLCIQPTEDQNHLEKKSFIVADMYCIVRPAIVCLF